MALLTFGFKYWGKTGLELLPALSHPGMFNFVVNAILDCKDMSDAGRYAIVHVVSNSMQTGQVWLRLLISNPENPRNDTNILGAQNINPNGITAPMWTAAYERAKQSAGELIRR
jgi:hypothetical protein